MSEAKSNTLRRLVGRSSGPKLPKECRTCKWYDPQSEAYACEVCPVNEGKVRECYSSACPHWRTGNECMYDGLCTANAPQQGRRSRTLPAVVGGSES